MTAANLKRAGAEWAIDQVKNIGFPIVVSLAAMYFIHDQNAWMRERFATLIENNTAAMEALCRDHGLPRPPRETTATDFTTAKP